MRDLQFQPQNAGVNLLLPYLWADSYEGGAPSFLDSVDNRNAMSRATGLGSDMVIAPLWATTAVPLMTPERARVLTANPSIQGHPFLWMPVETIARAEIDEGGGNVREESNEEWALRILLEALYSGWFDPRTGRWLDIVKSSGLGMDRVRTWLSSASVDDPEVAALSAPLAGRSPGSENWDLDLALNVLPLLQTLGRSFTAEELSIRLDRARKDSDFKEQSSLLWYGSLLEYVNGVAPADSYWYQLSKKSSQDPQVNLTDAFRELDRHIASRDEIVEGTKDSVFDLVYDIMVGDSGILTFVPTVEDPMSVVTASTLPPSVPPAGGGSSWMIQRDG